MKTTTEYHIYIYELIEVDGTQHYVSNDGTTRYYDSDKLGTSQPFATYDNEWDAQRAELILRALAKYSWVVQQVLIPLFEVSENQRKSFLAAIAILLEDNDELSTVLVQLKGLKRLTEGAQ